MNRRAKFFISILFIFVLTIVLTEFNSSALSFSAGPPQGRTGSPGDGDDCTGCHGSIATTESGIITTTIPAAGYIPGTTYTITATISQPSITTYGFQISPQKTNGAKVGTLIITNPSKTQLLASGKYITHQSGGISAPGGTNTWTFNWTAPAAGTGAFTFYGAFLIANGNGSLSGDHTILSSLNINEDTTTGIETFSEAENFLIYPNPFSDEISISFGTALEKDVDVTLFDVSGRVVVKYENMDFSINKKIDLSDLVKGMYVINVKSDNKSITRKIIKK